MPTVAITAQVKPALDQQQNAANQAIANHPIDSISLGDRDLPSQATPQQNAPTLNVRVSADQHTINSDIYGISFADEELATALNLPVGRWGGDHTTRYNWQTDTFNRNREHFFENRPEANSNLGALPTGSSADRFVEQNQRVGSKTMLTIPMIGWAPKDRNARCSYRVAKYGPQQETDVAPAYADCGNGIATDGTPIIGNDPTDTSVATDPAFAQAWMQHLINRFGTAAEGGVAYYALDNEPTIWGETHRDVYPEPMSYDKLRERTYEYAAAIKQTDPTAKTFGPVFWGWTAYFYSTLDQAAGGSWWNSPVDRNAHDGTELVAWYLQQMQAYEQQNNIRILDYLDLHYYPRATGVALAPVGDPATADLRLRTTRGLWDPSYRDESWINEEVQLIPRMHKWVADNYPGTKLAISEYNWGALDDINGALAQADVLGIFGRERLDLATLWEPLGADQPFAFAFRMYRNYDGAGSTFGNRSVNATSTDQGRLSVYAAQQSATGLMTIIVINKTSATLTSPVTFDGFIPGASAKVYRYSSNDLAAIELMPEQPLTKLGFTGTFPGNSITLFELPIPELFLPIIQRN